MTHKLIYGETLPGKHNLFIESVIAQQIDQTVPSVTAALKPLDQAQKQELMWLRNNLIDPATYQEHVASGKISPAVAEAGLQLESIATKVEVDAAKLAAGLGEKYNARQLGDLGLPHNWDGDPRISLADASGRVVTVVAGRTKKGAQALADRLVKEDPNLHIAEQMDISRLPEGGIAQTALGVEIKSTGGAQGNPQKLRGFKWDYEPVDEKELINDFQKAYNKKLRWQIEQTEKDILTQPLAVLQEIDPGMFNTLDARLRTLRGQALD
jgi:hypothetical protein